MHIFIHLLFNNISYSIAGSKQIQKTEWLNEIGRSRSPLVGDKPAETTD